MDKYITIFKEKVKQNQLGFFLVGSLSLAIFLIFSAMIWYKIGGTAQLDLSRPSYQEAREQARKDAEAAKKRQKQSEEWNFDGNLNKKSLSEFEKIFAEKIQKIDGDFFDEKTLSDETLNLTDEIKQESEQ